MLKRISFFLAATFITLFASAQEVKVRGTFQVDSARIGELIPYSLTARYSKNLDVLFPDSAYSFAPFEFHGKRYFTTETKDSLSYDSVVYYLSNYDIKRVQQLSLPVFVIHPRDCTQTAAAYDSIRLVRTLTSLPDSISLSSLPLKMNTTYMKVAWAFNYMVLLIIVALLIVVCIVLWLVFGKQVRRHFTLRRMEKNHQTFLVRYQQAVTKITADAPAERTEELVLLWKKYMEGLTSKPFTKYTSKEIHKLEANEKLVTALRNTDRIIYGGLHEHSEQTFSTLRAYAEFIYKKRTEEVKNG